MKIKHKVNKGAPSGFVISLMVHAAAFSLAGLLVVFTVHQKEEKTFVPPKPVDRPKMKLKKPQVKVKKSAKPKSTTRIVTNIKRASMPDIQLPEMSGMGGAIGADIGGFNIMPDVGSLTMLGSAQSVGSDLEGTFYDFNRSRSGHPTGIDVLTWREEFRRFLLSGWKPSSISKYYRAPQKLYASSLIYPPSPSTIAPASFGEQDAAGAFWLVHYTGKIVHRDGITFRFWVNADEVLAIKLNNEIVAACTWRNTTTGEITFDAHSMAGLWETSDSMASGRYFIGNNRAIAGDWITLEPGVPVDMEMVLGDNGVEACFIVAVEEKGVEYPKNSQGGPLLPAFKTAEFSRDMLDVIYKNLVDGEICLTNGPVFNDYGSSPKRMVKGSEPELLVEPNETVAENQEYRIWNLVDGKSIDARFVTLVGGKVLFESKRGKQAKVSLDQFSSEDLDFIMLRRPPKLDIDLIKDIKQKTFAMELVSTSSAVRPPEDRCHFGMRIKQQSSGNYNYELFSECFVIGQERLGNKYILLDRQETSFRLTRENERMHEFMSAQEVILTDYIIALEPRGEKYATYLITVTDERGEVIAVSTPSKWLQEHLGNLKQLKSGNYMNKLCERVYPTRPPATSY